MAFFHFAPVFFDSAPVIHLCAEAFSHFDIAFSQIAVAFSHFSLVFDDSAVAFFHFAPVFLDSVVSFGLHHPERLARRRPHPLVAVTL